MNLELREQVARMMGWTRHEDGTLTEPEENNEGYGLYGYTPDELPPFEEDISAAWLVVEKLWHNFWPEGTGGPRYECHIHPDADGWHCAVCLEAVGVPIAEAVAPTAPEAICRAALAALEASNE